MPLQISALRDKRFWSYGRLKRPKRDIFAVFLSKFKLNFLSIFDGIGLHQVKELVFFRTPCKISALTDWRFWSYSRFKWPKRGIVSATCCITNKKMFLLRKKMATSKGVDLTILKPVLSHALKPDSLQTMIHHLTSLQADWRCPAALLRRVSNRSWPKPGLTLHPLPAVLPSHSIHSNVWSSRCCHVRRFHCPRCSFRFSFRRFLASLGSRRLQRYGLKTRPRVQDVSWCQSDGGGCDAAELHTVLKQ
jgi:hypothetical protein